ncbi:MAG: hypothetical protein A2X05_08250 [Bacteroidetes bacterium GWE2_41_25]|nr:MAG: hypothetical protein A2X03_00500 [Bacteroidetes bacterium GWA2_40_15]OFX93348.1 MAG: hypothetical protein A2X05_08250 [Bacteroidetes bacterium GWE2_41_25]OFX97803.1 MAG: hypothetical protein A2X06_06105 [Bacteroidetes bacterium GWC2_40_22]OFY60808.1 MAG: hypothetical protein A2X04_01595 [Bacteroidetes bacterium GWF2_41_9]HBH83770.1 hypothetical protein [Bacteroidales bacterium]
MRTPNLLKSKAHQCRRKIVIDEIRILRNFEGSHLIQDKILRELTKLHSLWFKSSGSIMREAKL